MQAIIVEEDDAASSEHVEFQNPYAVTQDDDTSDKRTVEVADYEDTSSAH